jgi:enterochelin esterase-like enzyme
MSLTGPAFLDGLVVLTAAAFVGVVAAWPRLSARTARHVAARVGALVLVNLLVLLTAASQLNAANLFFTSWADLRTAVSGHLVQTSVDRGGPQAGAPDQPVGGVAAPVASTPVPVTGTPDHGALRYVVHGPLSGLTGTVLVRLPPGYGSTDRRFPVLEAFQGYPSEPETWMKVYRIGRRLDRESRAGRLAEALVVIPQIEFPEGLDTEGVNGQPGQPQVETWLTRDVPEWIGAHFRVVPDRSAWATIGDSAGGFDAAMATILHPAQYGAAVVLGGYFAPEFGPAYAPFTRTSPLGRYYDLVRAVAGAAPPVSLWVQTSRADRVSYRSSAALLRAVRAPTAVHAVVLRDAGHRTGVWLAVLPQALAWLGAEVAGFRPR